MSSSQNTNLDFSALEINDDDDTILVINGELNKDETHDSAIDAQEVPNNDNNNAVQQLDTNIRISYSEN